MPELVIYVYPTFICFVCERTKGWIYPDLSIARFLHQITEYRWSKQYHRWEIQYRYCYYDRDTGMLHLPRHVLTLFLQYLETRPYRCIEVIPEIGRTIKTTMRSTDRNDKQTDLVEWLSAPTRYFKALEADTGIGKTYCSTKACVYCLGVVTLVQTTDLVTQWYNSFLEHTTLKPKDIFVIRGFKSIQKLIKTRNKYKVLIASQRTLSLYAQANRAPYDRIMPYPKLLTKLGVGAKITDEVDLCFFSNTIIDLRTTVRHNIFLSATYERSNPMGNDIFNLIYPAEIRYGSQHTEIYTDIYVYSYSLGAVVGRYNYNGRDGYMQSKYEWVLTHNASARDEFVRYVLRPLIEAHYVNYAKPGEKLLVLFSTKNAVWTMEKLIRKEFPQYKVINFLGSEGDEDDKYRDHECDIIVSTIKSFGRGRDLKPVITCLQLTSFQSSPQAKQCVGRLRRIKDRTTIYIDAYNREIASHVRHIKDRALAYKTKAQHYYEIRLN